MTAARPRWPARTRPAHTGRRRLARDVRERNRGTLAQPTGITQPARRARGDHHREANGPFGTAATRRATSVGLTRYEDRHSVARVIFHGNQGELRQPYREGQEDQLGALGFALNALVVWNAQYMDDAIAYLRANGHEIADEDLQRLSPLQHEHTSRCSATSPSRCPTNLPQDNGARYADSVTALSVRSCSIATGRPSRGAWRRWRRSNGRRTRAFDGWSDPRARGPDPDRGRCRVGEAAQPWATHRYLGHRDASQFATRRWFPSQPVRDGPRDEVPDPVWSMGGGSCVGS